VSDAGDQVPSIVLRDFSGSSDYRGHRFFNRCTDADVCREREDYTVSLDYLDGQLDENQAIEFVTGFVDRLGEPLRHLL
jgi:hypothetical protein